MSQINSQWVAAMRRAIVAGAALVAAACLPALALAAALEEPLQPLPRTIAFDAARAALGARLFADPQLSQDRGRSCSTCHPLDRAGVDGLRRPRPARPGPLLRNTPTVFNIAFDLFYNWDGSTEILAEHDARVLHGPALMGIEDRDLLARLAVDPAYASGFRAAYRDGLRIANVLDALAQFERSLITPDSRFDRYLRGEVTSISARERHGYELFKGLGCVSCHQGRNVGGNLIQRFGVFEDTSATRPPGEPVDEGRYAYSHDENDRQVFRVPSLRNVAVTAPYFHDGRAATLSMAVATMTRVQLGRDVPQADIDDLVAFLGTLTGKYQGRELRAAP
jgi:cytochrome c peroxidase